MVRLFFCKTESPLFEKSGTKLPLPHEISSQRRLGYAALFILGEEILCRPIFDTDGLYLAYCPFGANEEAKNLPHKIKKEGHPDHPQEVLSAAVQAADRPAAGAVHHRMPAADRPAVPQAVHNY